MSWGMSVHYGKEEVREQAWSPYRDLGSPAEANVVAEFSRPPGRRTGPGLRAKCLRKPRFTALGSARARSEARQEVKGVREYPSSTTQ